MLLLLVKCSVYVIKMIAYFKLMKKLTNKRVCVKVA